MGVGISDDGCLGGKGEGVGVRLALEIHEPRSVGHVLGLCNLGHIVADPEVFAVRPLLVILVPDCVAQGIRKFGVDGVLKLRALRQIIQLVDGDHVKLDERFSRGAVSVGYDDKHAVLVRIAVKGEYLAAIRPISQDGAAAGLAGGVLYAKNVILRALYGYLHRPEDEAVVVYILKDLRHGTVIQHIVGDVFFHLLFGVEAGAVGFVCNLGPRFHHVYFDVLAVGGICIVGGILHGIHLVRGGELHRYGVLHVRGAYLVGLVIFVILVVGFRQYGSGVGGDNMKSDGPGGQGRIVRHLGVAVIVGA